MYTVIIPNNVKRDLKNLEKSVTNLIISLLESLETIPSKVLLCPVIFQICGKSNYNIKESIIELRIGSSKKKWKSMYFTSGQEKISIQN